jgi:general stress protein 26
MNLESRNFSDIPQLIQLIENKSIGMLTCLDYGGALVSKPVTPLVIDNNGAVWFFIDIYSSSVSHLCNASLSFAEINSKVFMSISGSGEINKNQAHIESLWTDAAMTWFPDGPRSTNLALMKFSPYAAERWDESQSKMVSVFTLTATVVPGVLTEKINQIDINFNAIANQKFSQTFKGVNL